MNTTNLRAPVTRWQVASCVIPVILLAIGAALSGAPVPTPAAQAEPITIIATPAPMPPAVSGVALVAFFDYQEASTATPIVAADVARVIGQAVGDWRLVELAGGAHVWLRATDVPAGVSSDEPLADLTPFVPAPSYDPPVRHVPVTVAPGNDDAAICGPRPAGDKWVCSADGRGWIMPGSEDYLAEAPIEVQRALAQPVGVDPAVYQSLPAAAAPSESNEQSNAARRPYTGR